MPKIQKIATPFEEGGVFVNGAHSASMDNEFAEKTEALCYRTSLNVKHYAWPALQYFKATITNDMEWTPFSVGGGYGTDPNLYNLLEIPWQQTPGLSSIFGMVTLYSTAKNDLAVRLKCNDLVDPVAETVGGPSIIAAPCIPQRDRGLFTSGVWASPGFNYITLRCKLGPSELPANKRIAIFVDVMTGYFTVEFDVYISNIVLIEMPGEEIGF